MIFAPEVFHRLAFGLAFQPEIFGFVSHSKRAVNPSKTLFVLLQFFKNGLVDPFID
jgi:hypothetical protein